MLSCPPCCFFAVVTSRGSKQNELINGLLDRDDIASMPILGANETVNAEVGINLLKVIQLV